MNELVKAGALKREQIFQAALEEFLDCGFREASMDSISARAGASKRTVYKYFESKENLFRELMRRHWQKFSASFNVKYDKTQDIRAQLIALGEAQGRLLTSPEIMLTTRLVMSEILRQPELAEKNQEKIDYKSDFEEMLRDATLDGKLAIADPKAAAEEFVSLIKGKAFWPVIFGAPVVSEEAMAEIISSSVDMMMSRYGV